MCSGVSHYQDRSPGFGEQAREPTYTVYANTPTSKLTLVRSLSQLVEFDTALRSVHAISLSSPLDLLPPTLSSSSPPRKRRQPTILATLSRTLSPGKAKRSAKDVFILPEDQHPPLAQLSSYLSELGKLPEIRTSTEWTSFFQPKGSDLESHRVERRVKRIMSDPQLAKSRSGLLDTAKVAVIDVDIKEELVVASGEEVDVADSESLRGLAEIAAIGRHLTGEDDETPIATVPDRSPAVTLLVTTPPVQVHPADKVETKAEAIVAAKPAPIITTPLEDLPEPEQHIVVELPQRPSTADPIKPKKDKVDFPSRTTSFSHPKRRKDERKTGLEDFEVLRVLGKGCAGKVRRLDLSIGFSY